MVKARVVFWPAALRPFQAEELRKTKQTLEEVLCELTGKPMATFLAL